MPLPRLQIVGGNEEAILYRINWDASIRKRDFNGADFDNAIRFIGEAADHLVRLTGLLRPLIQRQWASLIASYNTKLIQDCHLENFLFGVDRIDLSPVRPHLRELQDNRCFYCEHRISGGPHIDHFIPWSRYPNNAIENLVLADDKCNGDKSDHLVSASHVQKWSTWTAARQSDLDTIAEAAHWERHAKRSRGVARAIYLRLPTGASLWESRRKFVALERGALQQALM